MLKKISLVLLCIITETFGSVYSVDTRTALMAISNATKYTLVFVNIDLHDLDDLYTSNYDDILKKAHTLCQRQKPEGYEIISYINSAMKTIDPLYISSYRLAPHVIGITRRSLRWSHLIRGICYEQGVKEPATRFLLAIEKSEPQFENDYEFIECNTGILYIDNADIGKAMSRHIINWELPCYGVIYVDTNKAHVESCIKALGELHPNIKAIGLHVIR